MSDIRTAGESARVALEALFEDENLGPEHKERRAESHLLRYNLWASDLGIFKDHPHTIDDRLRKNKLVRTIIQDILEATISNAKFCMYRKAEDYSSSDLPRCEPTAKRGRSRSRAFGIR